MINMSMESKQLLENLKKFSSETYYHSLRVKNLTLKMLKYVNHTEHNRFSQFQIDCICKGALFHDIGKLYVKNNMLTKKAPLSPVEMSTICLHTKMGDHAMLPYLSSGEKQIVSDICRYHHERIDGSGYEGMEDIPEYVQMVSICDAFDALQSERVYRKALPVATALQMIEEGKCGHFSKKMIEYLKATISEGAATKDLQVKL